MQLNELFMREIWKSEKVLKWSRSSSRKAEIHTNISSGICKCNKEKWGKVDEEKEI